MASSANSVVRPSANFSPSLWGNIFSSFEWDDKELEMYDKEIEILEKAVRSLLQAGTNDTVEKSNLIDTLERLGLSYKFEEEIEEHLQQVFNSFADSNDENQYDLCTAALLFRMFRQHGYDISSGIFNKFTDNNGNFKEEISKDVEALLRLYEASYLRRHGEHILEEALAFTKGHLMRILPHLNSLLEKQVRHALDQPLHRGIPRLEARHYISIYEKEDNKNEDLLRLAKLDFNQLQMLHKKEICEITRWWKSWDFVGKLPYLRDRVVECYFWALGLYFEPRYSLARIMSAKTVAMTSILDDTYDSYGTIEELEVFTAAVERWNIEEIDRLPSYLKVTYMALLNLYEEFDEKLKEQGRSFTVPYAKERMKELIRSYNREAKWFIEGHMPLFDEYMENALSTSTYLVLMPSLLLGVESATREVFDWVMNNPRIVMASAKVGRCTDDVASYTVEKERGQAVCGIEGYMRQYGVSKEEAFDKFYEFVDDSWKDINEDYVRSSSIPTHILLRALNQTRVIDVAYKHGQDGYTHPEKVVKPHIMALLVNPTSI